MNNTVFGETMENKRNHRDITTKTKRKYLVSELSHHTTKIFSKTFISHENKKNTNTYEQTCLFRSINAENK